MSRSDADLGTVAVTTRPSSSRSQTLTRNIHQRADRTCVVVPWLNGNITSARVRTRPRFNVTFFFPACHSSHGCLALLRLRVVCGHWGKVSPGAQPRCAGTDPTAV